MKLTQEEMQVLNDEQFSMLIIVRRSHDDAFVVRDCTGESVKKYLTELSLEELRRLHTYDEPVDIFNSEEEFGMGALEQYALNHGVLDLSTFPLFCQTKRQIIPKVRQAIKEYEYNKAEWLRINKDIEPEIPKIPRPHKNKVYTNDIWEQLSSPQQTHIAKLCSSNNETARSKLYKIVLAGNILHRVLEDINADIPEYLLTRQTLSSAAYGPAGRRTALHVAAVSGAIEHMPKEILTDQAMLGANLGSGSVIETAIRSNTVNCLPFEALQKAVVHNDPTGALLHYLATTKTLANYISPEQITTPCIDGSTPIHHAAMHRKIAGRVTRSKQCCLNALPGYPKILNLNNLTTPDNNGTTPMHLAAETIAGLEQIPKEFITEKTLTIKDKNGNTPMHVRCTPQWAVSSVFIPTPVIPDNLLTEHTLFIKNNAGHTPIADIITIGGLKTLPDKFKTLEYLTSEISGKQTAIHILSARNKLDEIQGLALPEHFRNIVGEKWFDENQHLVNAKNKLTTTTDTPDLEIF